MRNMRVILPVAGRGKRLKPHTDKIPKPMLMYDGKPVIGHILDMLALLPISEYIFVIGCLGHQIQAFVETHYKIPVNFIVQKEQLGLGHAVKCGLSVVEDDEPVLIVLGDVIPTALQWQDFTQKDDPSRIAVQEVIYQKPYGLAHKNYNDNAISNLQEKPFEVDLKIAGCYYIKESKLLFNILQQMVAKNKKTYGEFQLTDALAIMVAEYQIRIDAYPIRLIDWESAYRKEQNASMVY